MLVFCHTRQSNPRRTRRVSTTECNHDLGAVGTAGDRRRRGRTVQHDAAIVGLAHVKPYDVRGVAKLMVLQTPARVLGSVGSAASTVDAGYNTTRTI